MCIRLIKANIDDCIEIQRMQSLAFLELFEKYHDYKTSPAVETVGKVKSKMMQNGSDYYFIVNDACEKVGVVRVVACEDKRRISPVFILPKYQGRGYATQAVYEAEKLYSSAKIWQVDTIKQERKLCDLYQRLGYSPTGKEESIQDNMTIIFLEKEL